MAKYDALFDHLSCLDGEPVELAFTTIADIVGGLPSSATTYREWWANPAVPTVHAKSWLDAGYSVDSVDLEAGVVRFVPTGEQRGPGRPALNMTDPPLTPTGAATKLNVEVAWLDGGDVALDDDGAPRFCRFGTQAAVYVIDFEYADGSSASYVGETASAYTRFAQYRSGKGGSTNIRINEELRSCVGAGGGARLSICTSARIGGLQGERDVNLTDGNDRRLIEAAAVAEILATGRRVINAIVGEDIA